MHPATSGLCDVHKALMRGTGAKFYAIVPSLQRESEIKKRLDTFPITPCILSLRLHQLSTLRQLMKQNLQAIKVELGWQREDIAHS